MLKNQIIVKQISFSLIQTGHSSVFYLLSLNVFPVFVSFSPFDKSNHTNNILSIQASTFLQLAVGKKKCASAACWVEDGMREDGQTTWQMMLHNKEGGKHLTAFMCPQTEPEATLCSKLNSLQYVCIIKAIHLVAYYHVRNRSYVKDLFLFPFQFLFFALTFTQKHNEV